MKRNDNVLNNIDNIIVENYTLLNQLRLVYDFHELTIGKVSEITKTKIDTSKDDILVRLSLHTLFTISTLDLLAILSLQKKATIKWENILLLRSAYLTIYESVKAFEKRKNGLRRIIELKNLDIKKFDETVKELRDFKAKFSITKIEKIRNKIAGHIDDDFKDYFDTLIEIDVTSGLDAVINFLNILDLLGNYLEDIRIELNNQVKNELQELQEKAINQMENLKNLVENLKE